MKTTLWNKPDRPLILASQSPRRRQILSALGLAFTVETPSVDNEHEWIELRDLHGSLRELARQKAATVAVASPGALVLGADTIVVLDGHIMGKPGNREQAREMIERLSGQTHEVWSGVTLMCRQCEFDVGESVVTRVQFRHIPPPEVDEYLCTASYMDKAGAYGIQDAAMAFVEELHGCYYNVVGLPVAAVVRLLHRYQQQGNTDT